MRRTLAVLVTAGAFLVPAGTASAAEAHTNASCNNMKSGNYTWTGHTFNGNGHVQTAECVAGKRPVKERPVKEVVSEDTTEDTPVVGVY